jgi:hypothetical protein
LDDWPGVNQSVRSIHGKSSEYVNDGGHAGSRAGGRRKDDLLQHHWSEPSTSLAVGYQALKQVRLSVWAVNLFNWYPNKIHGTLESYYDKAKFNSAVGKIRRFLPPARHDVAQVLSGAKCC